jgi:hypothetical protein
LHLQWFSRFRQIALPTLSVASSFYMGAGIFISSVGLSGFVRANGKKIVGEIQIGQLAHLRLKFSASFTIRQSGIDSPFAILSATVRLGMRSPRSTNEIILDDKSARSASRS